MEIVPVEKNKILNIKIDEHKIIIKLLVKGSTIIYYAIGIAVFIIVTVLFAKYIPLPKTVEFICLIVVWFVLMIIYLGSFILQFSEK